MPNPAWRAIALCAPLVLGSVARAETVRIPLLFKSEATSSWTLVRLGTSARTTDGSTVWSRAEVQPPAPKDRKPEKYAVLKVTYRVKDSSGNLAQGQVVKETAIDVDEADREICSLPPRADGYFLEITHDTKKNGPMVVPLALKDSNGNQRVFLYESKMASSAPRLLASYPGYIDAKPVVSGRKMKLREPRTLQGAATADSDAGSVVDATILVKSDNSVTITANAYPLDPL